MGGAARQAHDDFGAEWGVGEGLTGQCYAFPTLDCNMKQFSNEEMECIKNTFYRACEAHPNTTFLLTPVGTGIAGYKYSYIDLLFCSLPQNVKKVSWENE